MKISICILTILIVLLDIPVRVRTQNNAGNIEGVQMLIKFYSAYNTAWSTSIGETLIRKLDSLQRKYCTKKLLRKQKKIGLEHDLLINDQHTDVEHLKTLTVTIDGSKLKAYIVSYIAPTRNAQNKPVEVKVVIHVTLVKEDGSLKLASTDMT